MARVLGWPVCGAIDSLGLPVYGAMHRFIGVRIWRGC